MISMKQFKRKELCASSLLCDFTRRHARCDSYLPLCVVGNIRSLTNPCVRLVFIQAAIQGGETGPPTFVIGWSSRAFLFQALLPDAVCLQPMGP